MSSPSRPTPTPLQDKSDLASILPLGPGSASVSVPASAPASVPAFSSTSTLRPETASQPLSQSQLQSHPQHQRQPRVRPHSQSQSLRKGRENLQGILNYIPKMFKNQSGSNRGRSSLGKSGATPTAASPAGSMFTSASEPGAALTQGLASTAVTSPPSPSSSMLSLRSQILDSPLVGTGMHGSDLLSEVLKSESDLKRDPDAQVQTETEGESGTEIGNVETEIPSPEGVDTAKPGVQEDDNIKGASSLSSLPGSWSTEDEKEEDESDEDKEDDPGVHQSREHGKELDGGESRRDHEYQDSRGDQTVDPHQEQEIQNYRLGLDRSLLDGAEKSAESTTRDSALAENVAKNFIPSQKCEPLFFSNPEAQKEDENSNFQARSAAFAFSPDSDFLKEHKDRHPQLDDGSDALLVHPPPFSALPDSKSEPGVVPDTEVNDGPALEPKVSSELLRTLLAPVSAPPFSHFEPSSNLNTDKDQIQTDVEDEREMTRKSKDVLSPTTTSPQLLHSFNAEYENARLARAEFGPDDGFGRRSISSAVVAGEQDVGPGANTDVGPILAGGADKADSIRPAALPTPSTIPTSFSSAVFTPSPPDASSTSHPPFPSTPPISPGPSTASSQQQPKENRTPERGIDAKLGEAERQDPDLCLRLGLTSKLNSTKQESALTISNVVPPATDDQALKTQPEWGNERAAEIESVTLSANLISDPSAVADLNARSSHPGPLCSVGGSYAGGEVGQASVKGQQNSSGYAVETPSDTTALEKVKEKCERSQIKTVLNISIPARLSNQPERASELLSTAVSTGLIASKAYKEPSSVLVAPADGHHSEHSHIRNVTMAGSPQAHPELQNDDHIILDSAEPEENAKPSAADAAFAPVSGKNESTLTPLPKTNTSPDTHSKTGTTALPAIIAAILAERKKSISDAPISSIGTPPLVSVTAPSDSHNAKEKADSSILTPHQNPPKSQQDPHAQSSTKPTRSKDRRTSKPSNRDDGKLSAASFVIGSVRGQFQPTGAETSNDPCPITTDHFRHRVFGLVSQFYSALAVAPRRTRLQISAAHLNGDLASVVPVIPPLGLDDLTLLPDDPCPRMMTVSSWIDLGSSDPVISNVSRQVFDLEVGYAEYSGVSHVGIAAPRWLDVGDDDSPAAGEGPSRAKSADSSRTSSGKPLVSSRLSLFSGAVRAALTSLPGIQISIITPMAELPPFNCRAKDFASISSLSRDDLFSSSPPLKASLSSILPAEKKVKPNFSPDEGQLAGWECWHSVRQACDYSPRLTPALVIPRYIPAGHVISSWGAERISALIIPVSTFVPNQGGYPVLTRPHQSLIQRFLARGIRTVVVANFDTGASSTSTGMDSPTSSPKNLPLSRSYALYLNHILTKFSQQETQSSSSPDLSSYTSATADVLQWPLQPLAAQLPNTTYAVFEADEAKYDAYEAAVAAALRDLSAILFPLPSPPTPPSPTSQLPHPSTTQGQIPHGGHLPRSKIVVAVVGSGRGGIVDRVLKASASTHIPVELWAVEKNAKAVISLQVKNQREWNRAVHVVHADMRTWSGPNLAHNPPRQEFVSDSNFKPLSGHGYVDLLVSELLGSFADNELSPECLDGAERVLHPVHGISIPSEYASYATPISAPGLHSQLRYGLSVFTPSTPSSSTMLIPASYSVGGTISRTGAAGESRFDSPYVVNLRAVRYLSPVPTPSTGSGLAMTLAAAVSIVMDLPAVEKPLLRRCWGFTHPRPSLRLRNENCAGLTAATAPARASANAADGDTIGLTVFSHVPSEPGQPTTNKQNERYTALEFPCPNEGVCDGVAGYFTATLYTPSKTASSSSSSPFAFPQPIKLSTLPGSHTPNMQGWFPFFFPLRTPVRVSTGGVLQLHLWRHTDGRAVWYDWMVESWLEVKRGAESTTAKVKPIFPGLNRTTAPPTESTAQVCIGTSEIHSSKAQAYQL